MAIDFTQQIATGTSDRQGKAPVPLVSIILTCRCELEHIEEALASILHQEPPDGGFEVIVADGMSEDGTRPLLRRIADSDHRVKLIDNPAKFTSNGLNAAIRAAAGRILVRMDAHTSYAPDYVRQCVNVLRSTGADNVGGPWIPRGTTYVGEVAAAAFQSRFAVGGARSHMASYEGEVDSVYLGCWNREAFERFGDFDETLIRNQDDEHNLRIVRSGGRVWQSSTIRSWYHVRTTLKGLFRQYLQYGYWKVLVIRKHGKPASLRHLVPGAFVFALLLLVFASSVSATAYFWLPASGVWETIWQHLLRVSLASLAVLASIYGLALVCASLFTACATRWKYLPVLPLAFWCYHFGYGFGFLRGVLDLLILRRGAEIPMTALTREAPVRSNSSSGEIGEGLVE